MDIDGLEFLRVNGWQNSDEAHPPRGGHSGYRIVWRCLAWVVHPEVVFGFSNMRIRISLGDVDTGGIVLPNAIPMRSHDRWILPQKIYRTQDGNDTKFESEGIGTIDFKAWQETVSSISYMEILVRTEAREPGAILNEGRRTTSSILTLLQFSLGPRVSAVQVTEEVGEIFEDWHWNRSLASDSLAWEPQLNLHGMQGSELVDTMKPLIDRWLSRDEEKRTRARVASQWWQLAEAQGDLVIKYISLWLVAESLVDKKNMPTKLYDLIGHSLQKCEKFIRRLYTRRCELTHGKNRDVSTEEIAEIRSLAGAFLSADLCTVPLPSYIARVEQSLRRVLPKKRKHSHSTRDV
ncbi:hypothetical protein [Acrocarpospora macrocephala]|uniref:hypothetical protein n=1 Tax=Acrocarpospora macrocephala TaxID=150177 RepID=UPI0012D33318|nr:hypothetical protein [Acrocarpospora macrocephala]